MTRSRTTDPADELFDVVDEDGIPTGETKRRADVHRDGDWHRAFHLWLAAYGDDGESRVLFQRRSSGKDTWPNRLDVAVGGHFRAGETIEDVVREIDEEIGIQRSLSDLVFIGRRRVVSDQPHWLDRELEEVYVVAFPDGYPIFRPNVTEVASLVQVRVVDLVRLFRREIASISVSAATVVADRTIGEWTSRLISVTDFVPVSDDYTTRGALAAEAVLVGAGSPSL